LPESEASQLDIPKPLASELGVDEKAIQEFFAVSRNIDLSDKKKLRSARKELEEKQDGERARHVHRIVIWYFYLFAISGMLTFLVVLWHIITPNCVHFLNGGELRLHFLNDEELTKAAEFLAFGGAGLFADRASKAIK